MSYNGILYVIVLLFIYIFSIIFINGILYVIILLFIYICNIIFIN